jgi:hypothetical protein
MGARASPLPEKKLKLRVFFSYSEIVIKNYIHFLSEVSNTAYDTKQFQKSNSKNGYPQHLSPKRLIHQFHINIYTCACDIIVYLAIETEHELIRIIDLLYSLILDLTVKNLTSC